MRNRLLRVNSAEMIGKSNCLIPSAFSLVDSVPSIESYEKYTNVNAQRIRSQESFQIRNHGMYQSSAPVRGPGRTCLYAALITERNGPRKRCGRVNDQKQ